MSARPYAPPSDALRASVGKWLAKCVRNASGCLLWTGAVMTRGYGKLRVDKVLYPAHRAFFMVSRGCGIGADMDIGHTCNNPGCVEPSHLEVVTRSENMRYMVACGRGRNQFQRRYL